MDGIVFSTSDAGSTTAQEALARYFAELSERFPEGFDGESALAEALDAFNPPHGEFVLAFRNGEPVGCGALQFFDGNTAEIKRMWVSPDARGLGLGKRLLAHLEGRAREAGRRRVTLDTHQVLTEAVSLYQGLGYTPIPRYNSNPHAHHWFAKTLTDPD